jgi:hypothetical protein
MPLMDHFHDPLKSRLPYATLHSGWGTYLASDLIDNWLPAPYLAVEHANHGAVEIDVATYETGDPHAGLSGNGGVATLPKTWAIPPKLCTVPLSFPDRFEVLVYADANGWELVGAIEIVSRGNKDRPDSREAFVGKCGSYLHEGVSLVIVDIVTCHHFNLHNDLLELVGATEGLLPGDVYLYASAYRPVVRGGKVEMDVWAEACALGSPLPTMPLRLKGDLVVPVELEATYMTVCRKRRLV